MLTDVNGRSVDLDAHMAKVEEDGVTIVEGVIGDDEVAALRAAVDDAVEAEWQRHQGRPGKEHFIALDLVGHGGAFWKFLENPLLDAMFGGLLGEQWVLYSFTSTLVYPDLDQYTCKVHTDTGRDSGDYRLGALATLALDDFTFENGTTWFIPGSHRGMRERPSDDEFFAKAVRYERPAGSVALFDPRIWHAGGENRSGKMRSGCTPYACRSFMRQRFDFPRLVEKANLDPGALGPTARRVLGYNVRVPSSLDEFYVPAEERLYLGGQG